MTFGQFLLFMLGPAGALIAGYIALRSGERETERFDRSRNKPKHSH